MERPVIEFNLSDKPLGHIPSDQEQSETPSSSTPSSRPKKIPDWFYDSQPKVHRYADPLYFLKNPPIPVFNYIVDQKTLKIVQDLTGQP